MANAEGRTGPGASGSLPEERRMAAWVGKALLIQGKITSSENLTIDGRVEGTIELGDRSLTIGTEAAVHADLVAQSIVISGTVVGNVLASVKVDLHATASVTGDITSPVLMMADGAVVTGAVDAGGRKRSSS
jgi:cytoskeletal protein CcmA (bactofilin family)